MIQTNLPNGILPREYLVVAYQIIIFWRLIVTSGKFQLPEKWNLRFSTDRRCYELEIKMIFRCPCLVLFLPNMQFLLVDDLCISFVGWVFVGFVLIYQLFALLITFEWQQKQQRVKDYYTVWTN